MYVIKTICIFNGANTLVSFQQKALKVWMTETCFHVFAIDQKMSRTKMPAPSATPVQPFRIESQIIVGCVIHSCHKMQAGETTSDVLRLVSRFAQAVTEEQLASQFAPSTASQPRYQGQHSVQRQQHNHAFFLHQGQDDDQDSCSLLGSDSDSESDEGEDHNHYDSYFNASTYSGSSYGHGLVATSPHKYQNGNDFFALLADSEGGAQPAALSEQHTTGVGLGQKGPESVSGAESLVDGMEQQGFVLRTSGPAFPNEAPSSAAKTSVQGSGRNSIRNTAPGPPAPNKSSSMGPVGGLAAVVAPGGGGSGGGEAWGALTVTGGRKAAVFGKPYMLSSGSHPLVRIVLQVGGASEFRDCQQL